MIYTVLEDRRTIHVIITKFLPLRFKMVPESFENVDIILRDWAKYKVQTILVEALTMKQEEQKKSFLKIKCSWV